MPFYTQWGNISFAQIQLLQAWFMLCNFLLEIPTGVIADKFGRKTSLVLGSMVAIIASIIYGSISNFYIFLLGELLFALAMALISGADNALLYDTLKETNQEDLAPKVFGKSFGFHMAGLLFGAPIGSFIASKFGLNFPMLLMVIPFALATIFAFKLKEIKNINISESVRYFTILKKGMSFFINNKKLSIVILNAILIHAASYYVIWLYQPLLMKINIPIIFFGYFHAVLVGLEIIVSHNFHFIEKIFKNIKNYLIFTAIVVSLGFFIVALYTNILTIFLFLILAGGFGLTRLTFIVAYINKLIPTEERATINSFISMFSSLSLVIINPLVGLLIDRTLVLSLFAISILPLIALIFFPIKNKDGIS